MKKLIVLILCLVLLTACSSDTDAPDLINGKYMCACYEFDAINNVYSTNNVLNVYIPSTYSVLDEASKPIAKNAYCLNSFINQSMSISIFQADKSVADLSRCSEISLNWSIEVSKINDVSKIYNFYSEQDNYILVISINNKESEMSLLDALKILSSIINEDCFMPKTSRKTVVKATLELPAKIDDWSALYIKNASTKKSEPICINIDKIYSAQDSLTLLNNYNIENPDNQLDLTITSELNWIVFDYSIYFPSSYTEGETGLELPELNWSLCNLDGSSNIIGGFTNIAQVNDISKPIQDLHKDVIWINGRGYYKAPINYTNYLIKLTGLENTLSYYSVS